MWHLEASNNTVEEFKKWYYQDIKKDIERSPLSSAIKDILLGKESDGNTILEHLLTDHPKALYSLNDKVTKQIEEVIKGLRDEEKREVWEKIRDVFGYEKRISQDRDTSYKLARLIGTDTCVYCNRIYTYTIDETINDVRSRVVRPDFDHWIPKAEFPLTSMSFFNLIPSCPICNRNVKNRHDFKYGTHVHPYESSPKPQFSFRYVPLNGSEWDVKLDKLTGKEEATAGLLHTEDIYKGHANKEVKDIIDFVHAYPPEYIRDLFQGVRDHGKIKITPEEAYRYLMGTELKEINDLNRPLSKLKRDIIKQACEDVGIDILQIFK